MARAIDDIALTFDRRPATETIERAHAFRALMARRRTVRDFAPDPVPQAVIADAIMTAASAPSGANRQPWHFVAIGDADIRRRIRLAAEAEEREFYASRAGDAWLDALAPLGTDAEKPFLETAPWLIAVFAERHGLDPTGAKVKNYYVPESVGIAVGFLLAALHQAGLATLTHTPSPMGFLSEICTRPAHEKPYVLIVTGFPSPDCRVPAITRKPMAEVATFL